MEDEILDLKALRVEPDGIVPLHAPLSLSAHVVLKRPLPAASWRIVYEADFTNKRHVIPVFDGPVASLGAGEHAFHHAVDQIRTEGLKPRLLLQVGVLKLMLLDRSGPEPVVVASINMVTQVSKDPANPDALLRNIISPMD